MTQIVVDNVTVKFPIYRQKNKANKIWNDLLGRRGSPDYFNALDNLSVNLKDGDRVAIVGSNGAGKSTLLRVLSGILPPSSGQYTAKGSVFSLVTNSALLNEATCRQNIIMNGLYMGFYKKNLTEYIDKVESIAQLGDFIQSPLTSLSTGMRSRLMVAMIPDVSADILIMDEWIGTADQKVLKYGTGLLAKQINNCKILVIASHRNEILKQYCNKKLILREGKVESFECSDFNS